MHKLMRSNWLVLGILYSFIITSTLSLSSCGGGGGGGNAGGGTSADTTPPTVISCSPSNNATGVATNSSISVTFSEALNASTVTTSTVTLKDGSNIPISGTVNYTGTTATFIPASNLSYSTTYTVTVSSGVKDSAGNAMTSNYQWSFTSGVAPDTTPPTVSSTTPASNAIDIATNGSIHATFSEILTASTVNASTFILKDGSNNQVSGTVNYSGTTATFTPLSNLNYLTTYTATITTGIKDLAGNAITANYSWSFNTSAVPDTTPPTVVSTNPSNNVSSVAVNATISATFSETMNSSTINTSTFTLKDSSNNMVSGDVVDDGTTATFTPLGNLNYLTTYTATITTGTKDLAGNAITGNYSWSFTTGSAPDNTPPTVSSTNPTNNASDIAVNASISVTFSEAMNPSTINIATFTTTTYPSNYSNRIPLNGMVSYSGTVATFTPSSNLPAYTTCYAKITTGATDLAGNALSANYNWSFTTKPAPGDLDKGFGTSGVVCAALGNSYWDYGQAALIQPDGKIVVVGRTYESAYTSFGIFRLNTDGTYDTAFGSVSYPGRTYIKMSPSTGMGEPSDSAQAVALQVDNKIVVGGIANPYDSTNSAWVNKFALARLNTNGSLDTAFGSGGKLLVPNFAGSLDDRIYAIAIQSDGKILAAGTSAGTWAIARFSATGVLDSTFGSSGKVTNSNAGSINAMILQSDGKILVAGDAGGLFGLARYNTNGTLDTAFGTAGVATADVTSGTDIAKGMTLQSDGKIIVVGHANGLFGLARFNSNGTLDTSFGAYGVLTTDMVTGNDYAMSVAMQSDSKIVVAGYSSSYRYSVARYLSTGALDTTFGTGGMITTSALGSLRTAVSHSVIIQSDGKIVVAGEVGSCFEVLRFWP